MHVCDVCISLKGFKINKRHAHAVKGYKKNREKSGLFHHAFRMNRKRKFSSTEAEKTKGDKNAAKQSTQDIEKLHKIKMSENDLENV